METLARFEVPSTSRLPFIRMLARLLSSMTTKFPAETFARLDEPETQTLLNDAVCVVCWLSNPRFPPNEFLFTQYDTVPSYCKRLLLANPAILTSPKLAKSIAPPESIINSPAEFMAIGNIFPLW